MTGTVLAATVNMSGGTALTFFFPVGVFVVIGTVLYLLLFSRPHRRVPPRPISATAGTQPPDPGTALAAAVAADLTLAAGGGTAESHLEPQGADVATADASSEDAGDGETAADDTAADDTAADDTAADDTAADDTATVDTGAPE